MQAQASATATKAPGLTIDHIRGPGPTSAGRWRDALSEGFRRVCDIAVSLIALVLSSPVMLVLAMLVRLNSPGPALFWQRRAGRNRRGRSSQPAYSGPERRKHDIGGELFWLVKFRTMHVDARERFPELYCYEYTNEELRHLCFKLPNDPRHTRIGCWLRIMSLDELPNFWNALQGSMTLVGPRPDIPEMTRYYRPEQRRIFDVKPGITGYAQVNGRCGLKFQVTKVLDLRYVKERSLWVDFKVLLATVACVLRARGAF